MPIVDKPDGTLWEMACGVDIPNPSFRYSQNINAVLLNDVSAGDTRIRMPFESIYPASGGIDHYDIRYNGRIFFGIDAKSERYKSEESGMTRYRTDAVKIGPSSKNGYIGKSEIKYIDYFWQGNWANREGGLPYLDLMSPLENSYSAGDPVTIMASGLPGGWNVRSGSGVIPFLRKGNLLQLSRDISYLGLDVSKDYIYDSRNWGQIIQMFYTATSASSASIEIYCSISRNDAVKSILRGARVVSIFSTYYSGSINNWADIACRVDGATDWLSMATFRYVQQPSVRSLLQPIRFEYEFPKINVGISGTTFRIRARNIMGTPSTGRANVIIYDVAIEHISDPWYNESYYQFPQLPETGTINIRKSKVARVGQSSNAVLSYSNIGCDIDKDVRYIVSARFDSASIDMYKSLMRLKRLQEEGNIMHLHTFMDELPYIMRGRFDITVTDIDWSMNRCNIQFTFSEL